jgi:hypothetical protein
LIFEEAWNIGEDVDELVLGAFILLTAHRPWLVYPDRLFEKTSGFCNQTDSYLVQRHKVGPWSMFNVCPLCVCRGSGEMETDKRLTSVARHDSKASLKGLTANLLGPQI